MEKDSPFSSTGRRCIVTLMCIFVTAFVYAQQQKISISIKELPLKEAISQIAEKASMHVAYSKEFVDTSRKVSLEVKDTEVNKALTLLLKGTNIGFRFLDDSILFYNKEYQNKTEPVDSQGEKKELYVKGKVTDENAEPIIGATVSVKGSTTGTITDINGQYSIKVPYGSTLRYSYVGYREESVIAKATTVNVVMKENAVLVNIARGGLIDEQAMCEVLTERKDLFVALDVFEAEPLAEGSSLWKLENVAVSPHNSFVSDGNNGRMFNVMHTNLKNFISKKE